MTIIILQIVAVMLISFVTSSLVYLYLINGNKKELTLKKFFTFEKNKKKIIFSVASIVMALLVYLYSTFAGGELFLKAFMNSQVIIWLLAVGAIDFKKKIIPNVFILAAIIFWAILSLLEIFISGTPWNTVLLYSILGGGICGGVLLVVALIAKTALGMGDVKMFFAIGLLYGFQGTYSILLYSIFLMAIISIGLLIGKKVTKKTAVPMAPFVVVGFLFYVLLNV